MNPQPKVTSSALVVFAILHHVAQLLKYVTIFILPLSLFFGALTCVFFFLILHRGWCLVQDGQTDVTPGKAVGFCFIPIFSLYWIFVGIAGLPKQINRIAELRAAPDAKINPAFALVTCILTVSICLAPLADVFFIVVIWQIIGAIKVLEKKPQELPPPLAA